MKFWVASQTISLSFRVWQPRENSIRIYYHERSLQILLNKTLKWMRQTRDAFLFFLSFRWECGDVSKGLPPPPLFSSSAQLASSNSPSSPGRSEAGDGEKKWKEEEEEKEDDDDSFFPEIKKLRRLSERERDTEVVSVSNQVLPFF